jgi:LPS O-antigen subunit length determinant protein (WzzB/FepE family)
MTNQKTSYSADEVIDLRDLVAAVWGGKWIIIVLAAAGAIFGFYRLQQHQSTYTAELVLSLQSAQNSGGASGGVGRLANAIGLANVKIGNPTFDRLKLMLGSIELAEYLQERHDFIHLVYKDSWDPETKKWIKPQGVKFELRQKLNVILKQPLWMTPNLSSLAEMISRAIIVETVEGTSFQALRYSHSDPQYALRFLSTVFEGVDELLRAQDRAQAIQRKQYLENLLQQTSLQESQNIILTLLMREENSLMLLSTSINYAGRLIAKPSVSNRSDVPSLLKFVIVPAFGLALFGLVLAVIFQLYRKGA